MKLRRFFPDLCLLGMILAATVLFLALRTSPAPDTETPQLDEPTHEATIQLRASGLDTFLQEGIDLNELIGQPLDTGDGTVADCYWTTYRTSVMTEDGETVFAADPVKRDLVIILSAQMPGDQPTYTLAGQEIRMGRGFFFSAGPLYLPMTIVGFEH